MSQTIAQSDNTTDTNEINDVILLVDIVFFFSKTDIQTSWCNISKIIYLNIFYSNFELKKNM